MKDAGYHWRQTEWWAFYFELLCQRMLSSVFEMPGERINNVRFDAKGCVNWDFKAKAIKSDNHSAILNDVNAMDLSISRHGAHGVIVALCDVEYNDDSRSFQLWRTELEGGLSEYAKARRKRTSVSRYRKTRAWLREVLFLKLDAETIGSLSVMKQGRNSNGQPRPLKYMLNLEKVDDMLVDSLTL